MQATQNKRKAEVDNNDRPAKKQATEMSSKADLHNIFLLDELVEQIVSNLLTKPKAILNIGMVSKRHNQLVHSKAMWKRFGFTDHISNADIMPSVHLKFLLNSLRINHIRKKTARELIWLEKEANDMYGEGVYGIEVIQDYLNATSVRDFLMNKTVTDEAFGALYHIMSRTSLLRHQIDMDTFVELILSSEEQIEQEKLKRFAVNQNSQDQFYPYSFSGSYTSDLDDGVAFYRPLLYLAEMTDENKHACVLKRFISPTKFVIMMQGASSKYFIKLDMSKNIIECCGELQTYLGYTQNSFPLQTLFQQFNPKFAELFEVPLTPRLAELERSKMCMCHFDMLSVLGGLEPTKRNIPFLRKKM